jgi:superoxide oxidase
MHNRNEKYDNIMIALHWVIGIGILLLAGLEMLRTEFPKGHFIREGLRPIHQPLGATLFVLICIRVAWRVFAAKVPAEHEPRTAGTVAAGYVHFALYGLMIGLPILGMVYVFGNDKAIDFGLFNLAIPLKATLGSIAKSSRWWHETLGVGIFCLALLHAAAALFHHYVLKDGLIGKMGVSFQRQPTQNLVAGE